MSDLQRVVALSELMRAQAAEVERLETELKAAKSAYLRTEREDLPTLMEELGLTELKLHDGTVVVIKPDVDCGISEERRQPAMRWLEDNGFGALIKTKVELAFGRDQRDVALRTAHSLEEQGFENVIMKEEVHHATLKSFIKEQLENARPLPLDLFGVRPYNKATLNKKGK